MVLFALSYSSFESDRWSTLDGDERIEESLLPPVFFLPVCLLCASPVDRCRFYPPSDPSHPSPPSLHTLLRPPLDSFFPPSFARYFPVPTLQDRWRQRRERVVGDLEPRDGDEEVGEEVWGGRRWEQREG